MIRVGIRFLSPFYRLTVHNVTGLSPGKQYQFRVTAVNFYGNSDPCEPSKPITTEKFPEGKRGKEGIYQYIETLHEHCFKTRITMSISK